MKWGFFCKCCVEGEHSAKGEGGKQSGAGEGAKKDASQLETCLSLTPQGTLEHDLYHRVVLILRQRAGFLYFMSVSHWPWAASWGVWRCNLQEVALGWLRGRLSRREHL